MTKNEFLKYWQSIGQKLPEDVDELGKFIQDYSKFIDIWWNPETFPWNKASDLLVEFCFDSIELWWDPDKFKWKGNSHFLAQACYDKFEVWWDPEKYDWESEYAIENLILYCGEYFDLWWDRKKIPLEKSAVPMTYLIQCCGEHIEKWWDANVVKNLDPYIYDLFPSNIPDKIHIWWDVVSQNLYPSYYQNFFEAMIENCMEYHDKWINKETLEKIPMSLILKIPFNILFPLLPDNHPLLVFISNLTDKDLKDVKTRVLLSK